MNLDLTEDEEEDEDAGFGQKVTLKVTDNGDGSVGIATNDSSTTDSTTIKGNWVSDHHTRYTADTESWTLVNPDEEDE